MQNEVPVRWILEILFVRFYRQSLRVTDQNRRRQYNCRNGSGHGEYDIVITYRSVNTYKILVDRDKIVQNPMA